MATKFAWTPQIRRCVEPLDWLREKLYWSGFEETLPSPCADHRGVFQGVNKNSSFFQPPLYVADSCPQIADEYRLLAYRGNDGRVVRVKGSWMWFTGKSIPLTQTEKDTANSTAFCHPSPYPTTR